MGTTVVLIDDHEDFRLKTRLLLAAAGLEVVAEAATAREAVDVVDRARPDAVVLDVLLPDGTGFDVARELDRLDPRPRIVLISSRLAADFGRRLTESPADRFLAKVDLTVDSLREAVAP